MASPRRRPLTPRRLGIVVALVVSMMLTLFARLYYVQLLDPHKPVQSAHLLHDGVIVVPAPRGLIVDARGRPLVANTSAQVITVDRDLLQKRPDRGAAVLARLAGLLGRTESDLAKEITPCSPTVPAPCWTGEPYQPVPVAMNAPTSTVLAVSEHREQFPGVAVQTVMLPAYPYGSLAGHVLGYTSQITAADKAQNPDLADSDTIGASGLEQQYDALLRGVDGQQTVQLDPQGYAVRAGSSVPAKQGDTLVTSIDLDVQKLAERSLAKQIRDSRAAGRPATGGAVVVMNPNTGRILAVASSPTYDPSQFIGGISTQDYAALTDPSAGTPLLDRAIAGEYAPGSTFKLITSSSLVMHHEINTHDTYSCPGSVTIDGRVKTNYDSEVLGDITLRDALGYSCDTFFYQPAAAEYYRDQARIDHGRKAHEYLQRMAAAYGVGRAPRLDLPAGEQASGSYADRETRLARWQANRGELLRGWSRRLPGRREPRPAGLPHRAREGELHRRVALPRRRQRGHVDRAGRDDDVAAAARRRLLRDAQRGPDLGADARLGRGGRQGPRRPEDQTQSAQPGARQPEAVRLHQQLARLQPGLGGVGRVRLHRLEVPEPDRGQDRYR